MNDETMRRVVIESPVHGQMMVTELMRLLEEDAKRRHEIEVFLSGGPTKLDIAEANRENAERDLNETEARLPDGMKNCTIVFKECGIGHGWLTAKNWTDFGCPTCRSASLEVKAADLFDDLTSMAYLVEDWKLTAKLQVAIDEAKLTDMTNDRDGWKRDSLMWSTAWERELNGYYFPKTHRIDAAVVSTRNIIERLRTCERERDQVHAENKALKGTAYADRLLEAMNKAARKICVKCREGVLLCGKPGTYRHETTGDDRCRAEAIWLARDAALENNEKATLP